MIVQEDKIGCDFIWKLNINLCHYVHLEDIPQIRKFPIITSVYSSDADFSGHDLSPRERVEFRGQQKCSSVG